MQQNVIMGFVLDQSGSMTSVTKPTIDGFNLFLKEQQEQEGEALMSLTLFDSDRSGQPRLDVRFVARDIHEVPPLEMSGPNRYHPDGGTPLLDAVGATIKGIEKWQANHGDDKAVKIIILTDGDENTSREWHINHPAVEGDERDLLSLIKWKQAEGWEFVFMGANGAEWLERTFGSVITNPNAYMSYGNTNVGNTVAYRGLSSTMTGTRAGGQSFAYSNQVLASSAATMTPGQADVVGGNNYQGSVDTLSGNAPKPTKRTMVPKKGTPKRQGK